MTKLSCQKTAELVLGQSPQTYTAAYNAAESITASQVIMASARQNKPMINQITATPSPRPPFPGQGLKRKPSFSCWTCGQDDHIQRNCPKKQTFRGQKRQRGNIACYGCGKTNHVFRNCFQRNRGQRGGRGRGAQNNYSTTRRPYPSINYMQGMNVQEGNQDHSETIDQGAQSHDQQEEQYQ